MAITSDLSQRRLIKVFIASPGDLQPERRNTHAVVDEINRTSGRDAEVYIDLLGWEDTLPGVGRPQALIKQDVQHCDLFIGLLWKRWGTPPGEEYSSGFEEEFARALRRNQATGKPEIWLAFKRVEQAQLDDPGEQLQRVLAFKKAQMAARTVLFKEFDDDRDWMHHLWGWLTSHIVRLVKNDMEALKQLPQDESSTPVGVTVNPPSVSTEVSASPVSAPTEGELGTIPLQLREIAGKFFQAVTSNSESSYPEIMGSLDKFQTTRMFLTAKAWLASRFTYELLSTHEIHLLYANREQLEFIEPEYEIVIRTLSGDRYDSTAGWYWFADFEPSGLTNYLFSRAINDPRAEVRARVINLLNDASLYPESKILGFAETILNDTDEDVKKAALEYLTNSKNRALLPLLEEIGAHNDSLRHNARIAVLRLKIAVDPMAAFTEVPSSARDVSTEMLRLLAERIVSIPSAYYNVVCWLDRTLYSPVALIPAFKKRFQKEIGDLASWCVVHSDSLNTTSA